MNILTDDVSMSIQKLTHGVFKNRAFGTLTPLILSRVEDRKSMATKEVIEMYHDMMKRRNSKGER